ncbi:transglutaminase domain-containing protein [uncultured Methanobrevibacter sp.]|uniref:transglutaminase domain-containing protein n=1 Tax=uncultured Methanobrevibacter sp. TaxID=253161 RepID=UPI0025D89055|nr:transglutaminase domain-containing protein [uncultured Methanobrevibacter sp.]
MLFLILGTASATEISNVTSTDNENLMANCDELSLNNLKASESDFVLNSENNEFNTLKSTNNDAALTLNESVSNSTPVKTELSISNAHYSKSGAVFKVILKDANGTSLEGKKVALKINGKTYSATTQSNGAAYVTTSALSKGSYTAKVTFNGDNEYIKSSISKKVNVYSSIKVSDVKSTYGDSIVYSALFYKNTDVLRQANVKFTVNGKTYTVKTDDNGKANITLKLVPGTYKIKIYNSYSKETLTKTITVNKDSTKITGSNAYILPKTKFKYSVVLTNGHNQALKKTKVLFTYNNRQVTALTDSNGKATASIPALSKGTYTINYKYNGATRYKGASDSKKLYVKDSTTTLKSSALKMQYNDGSEFSVTATNSAGKALTNKNVKININGKTTTVKTDSKGVAKLAIGALNSGKYTAKYTYSTAGLKDYNTGSNTVTISKQKVSIAASDLVVKYNDGSSYQVTVQNKTGSPINGIKVLFNLNSVATEVATDENGVAKLPIKEAIGEYSITIQVSDNPYYTSSKLTKKILVNGTRFSSSDISVSVGTATTFAVKLLDGQSKPIVGKTVKFTFNNRVTSVQTDEKGTALLAIPGLTKGTYTVTFTDGEVTGSRNIYVVDTLTLKQVIEASQTVKKYIESSEELPKTVTINGVNYRTAQYLYLASQAIINLNANNKGNIPIKTVLDPGNPGAAANLGNLYDYLSVAKSIVNAVNSKGEMPNSVNSALGSIGYNGLVYAMARVVAFYDDYGIMPNYVTIKTYASTPSSSPLNSKNTITNLKPYLVATTNCQVGNSKIKSVVDSLTSGLTTDSAKARAIYNYVRDAVSYSFYYDTKYGAVGTLNAKTGNCVDQAHLLIAMYRTAGLAARYVHGTCVFSSGSTYGHVWAQVLIGDTWIVSDPTSVRNSFGTVVNWNNYNYRLHGYYASLGF